MAKHKTTAKVTKENSPELLLAAARTLFAKKGYDATTVKDIADRAKVNVSLVSYHFSGKEGLYRTCLEQFGKARLAVAQELLCPVHTLTEFKIRLGLFIDEFLTCHVEQPEITQIIHRERDLGLPHAADIFRNTFLKVFETLMEFFKAAHKAKLLRADIDMVATPALFFGGMVHLAQVENITSKYFGVTIKDKKFRDRVRQQLLMVFVDGLSAPAAREKGKKT